MEKEKIKTVDGQALLDMELLQTRFVVDGLLPQGLQFMDRAKEYLEMPKLTPELLRVFICRIEVYEKPEKYSQTCGNPIVIRYAFQLPEQDGLPALDAAMRTSQISA